MSVWNEVKKAIKDSLPDVVTNSDISGQSNDMIWKFDNSGLMTGSRLIVNESQEAIFVKGGIIEEIFDPGSYDLATENRPFLKQFLNKLYGGAVSNTAEIWFVNKASIMEIGWGTPSPLTIEDHKFGFPITLNVRCNGAITVKVIDSRLLFVELAGQGKVFSLAAFKQAIQGLLISKLRRVIGTYLQETQVGFVELQHKITVLEEPLMQAISEDIQRFGVVATACYVKGFSVSDDESWRSYKEYEAQIIKQNLNVKLKANEVSTLGQLDIQLQAEKMKTLNYDYQTERKLDIMEEAAKNPGLKEDGLGMNIGATVARQFNKIDLDIEMPKKVPEVSYKTCPSCGSQYQEHAKFCSECGYVIQRACAGCNAPITTEGKFCLECGKKINACKKCGKDNAVDAVVCAFCEQPLDVEKECKSCGKKFANGVKFCDNCGSALA